MKRYTYETEYGRLVVDCDGRQGEVIENSLDCEAILSCDRAKGYTNEQAIWGDIVIELFGEDEIANLCPPRDKKSEWCAADLTDFGMEFIFESGLRFRLDHEGAGFDDWNVE